MTVISGMPIETIRDGFTTEIKAQGGEVRECVEDGGRFFGRSVLPIVEEIRTGDRLQGGVAIRASRGSVHVHPYLFRLTCKNGAVLPIVCDADIVVVAEMLTPAQLHAEVRSAVARCCCRRDVFSLPIEAFRTAIHRKANRAIRLTSLLHAVPEVQRTQVIGWIFRRFEADEDQSQYGLLNAITSVARDVRNPRLRWAIEEGAGLLVFEGVRVGEEARELVTA